MKVAGFGCLGCGGFLGLLGLLGIVAAFVPGVINSSETGTAIGGGAGLCVSSILPIIVGVVLVVLGGRQPTSA